MPNDKTTPPATEAAAAPELPTISDHADRLELKPWQIKTIVARLHGEHNEKGERRFAKGVSLTTRMSNDDFDKALQAALFGRV